MDAVKYCADLLLYLLADPTEYWIRNHTESQVHQVPLSLLGNFLPWIKSSFVT